MKKACDYFRSSFSLRKGAAPIGVALILLASVFVLFTAVGAQIESQAVKTSGFSAVRECPDGIEQRLPSRVVLQYIDGVFHKWEEYDLGGKGEFCIFLRKPEQRRLSTGEAKTLLENSTRWREQTPAAGVREVLDPNDPRLLAPPAAPKLPDDLQIQNAPPSLEPDKPAPMVNPDKDGRSDIRPDLRPLQKLEQVIGTDSRVRVTTTESYPWNTIGYIDNTYASGSPFRGTGFIVSPYMVLTAGHMVYDKDEGGYVATLDFSGQRQMAAGDRVIRPYGTHSSSRRETNANYIDAVKNDPSVQDKYDYAAVFFNTSFSSAGINTYMPLVFNIAAAGIIQVAGYPAAVQGEGNSSAMWHSSGNVQSNTDRIVYYDADTSSGNSGGPVWQYFPDTAQHRVIAVHAIGSPSRNYGPRLVSQNQALIESWMAWKPPTPPAPSGGGGGGGGGCFIATAAYGSYLDPHVQVLRDFRDRYFQTNKPGQYFVHWYYNNSPPIAELIRKNETLRVITRVLLTSVIMAIQHSYIPMFLFILFMLAIMLFFFKLGRQGYFDRKSVTQIHRAS